MDAFDKLAAGYVQKAMDAVRNPIIEGLGGVTKAKASRKAMEAVGKSHGLRAFYSNAIRPAAGAIGAAGGAALGLGAIGTGALGIASSIGLGAVSRAAWNKGKAFLKKREMLLEAARLAKRTRGEKALDYVAARPLRSGAAAMAGGAGIGHATREEDMKESGAMW